MITQRSVSKINSFDISFSFDISCFILRLIWDLCREIDCISEKNYPFIVRTQEFSASFVGPG